jgi:DNA-binding MarR family transcriptional regulator
MNYNKLTDEHMKDMFLRKPLLKKANDMSKGEIGTLLYLYKENNFALAGEISKRLQITSGRMASVLKSLDKKGFISKKKGVEEYNYVESIEKSEVEEIAQKNKKKVLFGAVEQIVEINEHRHPYIQTTIRTVKTNLFGKKKTQEHIMYFDGIRGEVILLKPKQHKWVDETKNLLECSENQLVLAKAVMKEKNPLSITEIANKTGLDERTTSKNLMKLTEKAILTFHKEGKYKYFSSLIPFKASLEKLSSKEISTTVQELDETENPRESKISSEEINKFVRTWFKNSQVIHTKLIQVPFHTIIYSKKGKTRTIEINGMTKEVLE